MVLGSKLNNISDLNNSGSNLSNSGTVNVNTQTQREKVIMQTGYKPVIVSADIAKTAGVYVSVVQMLLKQDGLNALMYACMHALPEMVELLLNHRGCNPSQQVLNGNTPLIICCCMAGKSQTNTEKYVRVVQILLKQDNCGIDICNKNGENALMYACMHALPEIVELLLSHSQCDPSQQDQMGYTALIRCCYTENPSLSLRENKIRIVKLLLKHKNSGIAICNYNGQSALMYACQNAFPEVVELLLSHSECNPCQQESHGQTPLMYCCSSAERYQSNLKTYVRIVQILLEQDNCDIAICDQEGRNALMYACVFASPEIVELLLNHRGCNPSQQDLDGNTPLIICCCNAGHNQTNFDKYIRIVQMLLKQDNCGISICNKNDQNALKCACIFALPDIVELLLSHSQCDPSQQDQMGNTALISCCYAENSTLSNREKQNAHC